MSRFEKVSGAILNRAKKCVILGLGKWAKRTEWPLTWLRTVTETKVFGFILHKDYNQILSKNWTSQLSKFTSTLFSWASRAIDGLFQKAEILTIFALSKVWYRATVLPLPLKYAKLFEKHISDFLWKGNITNNVLARTTVCLSKDRGGLGIPCIRLKSKALFMRNIFRTIHGNSQGLRHYDFWLGKRLKLSQVSSHFFHLKGTVGKERDNTSSLFLVAFDYVTECLSGDYFTPAETEELTTKQIYSLFLDDLPDPPIKEKFPDQCWSLTWERLKSGVLSPRARGYLYLLKLIHDRVGTRERGHRLMPGRFRSPLCIQCETNTLRETSQHRYQQCNNVSEAWNWLYNTMISLDNTLALDDDWSILRLNFSKGLRENAILWLVGNFIEIVEREVVCKNTKLSVRSIRGILQQKKSESRYQALPELGPISGLDYEPQGIG